MLHRLLQSSSKLFRQSARLYTTKILHVTDSEGTTSFFDTIKRSTIVSYSPDKGLNFKPSDTKSHFIFGGDVSDRGKQDLAITAALVDFKKRHADTVTLIAGNRDIKQVRFIELAPNLIRERLLHTKQPRWIKPSTLPLDYVKAQMVIRYGRMKFTQESLKDYVHSLSIKQCQLIYLHWMLEKTMGCPHTFRFRREELEKQFPNKRIIDEDVLQSFLDESSPRGLTGQYLQNSQIAVIVPNTRVLAVHGGLTPYNIGRVPNMLPEDAPISDAHLWINAFNEWYTLQLQKWSEYQSTKLTQPGFTELDSSILPIPGKEKFVITADMLGENRQFTQVSPYVSDYLRKNSISVVLTGHQPSGDHPAILQSDQIVFINGDTSYANQDQKNPNDTRGDAGHLLEISAGKEQAQISIQATLADATPVCTELNVTPEQIEGDPYIGRVLSNGELVQCKLPSGEYRLAQQNGFQVTYSLLNSADLAMKLNENQHFTP